jgi:fucose 4-O-acetylase-like acetyltransferase
MRLINKEKVISNNRDLFIDYLKGLAILLVVFGHYYQTHINEFDNDWKFRLIYSSHMPFFIFISGITAFLVKNKQKEKNFRYLWKNTIKGMSQLMLPFFAWGIISYLLNEKTNTIFEELKILISNPDKGLWFLPTLFWCRIYLDINYLIMNLLAKPRGRSFNHGNMSIHILITTYVSLLICLYILKSITGSEHNYGLNYTLKYIPYFMGGYFWDSIGRKTLNNMYRIIPILIFALLFPYYHRTILPMTLMPIKVIGNVKWMNHLFYYFIGFAGIYIILEMAQFLYRYKAWIIKKTLIYLGQNSMRIYVSHIYFIKVINNHMDIVISILASLILSLIIQRFKILNYIFYGIKKS